MAVIETRGLRTHFTLGGGIVGALLGRQTRVVKAVDGVDLAIEEGEVFGLVGESGSGKSTLGLTLVRMHRPTEGEISFRGNEIGGLHGSGLRDYRRDAQIIFQDPYGSLNPRLTVAQIVEEPLRVHGVRDRDERGIKVVRALERVRLSPLAHLGRYPHELSGGLRQRVAIARAIVLEPDFIVADEPVSMLDVSIQAGVLDLLRTLSRELGLAVLYVSHDIATVRYICRRVAVMYHGRFVEYGDTDKVIAEPSHPYTRRLMAAIPSVDPDARRKRVELRTDDDATPSGEPTCGHAEPHWEEVAAEHFVACPQH
jgi:ABC-type oligopeptide transport system ATPase subunit